MALIVGTNLPDMLLGTIGSDTLRGLLADDILYGFDGDDLLQGADGDDSLNGGSGNDRMDGGAGEDFFYGGSGTDSVSYLSSTSGLELDLGAPTRSTGDAVGDIFLSVERFELTDFADTARGADLGEVFLAGAGDDQLFGLGGNDSLSGQDGDDRLIGGAGGDQLHGGAGVDVASYEDAAQAVAINLVTAIFTGDAAGDSYISLERLMLSRFDDAATLAGAMRYADGGAGRDTLFGSSQGDTLLGGAGRDQLHGNGGNDSLVAGNPAILLPGQDGDSLFGGSGNDTLRGGTGDVLLVGEGGADRLVGEAGDDSLDGGAGADVLNGGEGVDTAIYNGLVTINLLNPGAFSGEAAGDQLTSIEVLRLNGGGSFVGGVQAITVIDQTGQLVTAIAGAGAETFVDLARIDYRQATAAVVLGYLGGPQTRLAGSGGAAGDAMIGDAFDLVLSAFDDEINLNGIQALDISANMGDGNDRIILLSHMGDFVMGKGNDRVIGIAGSSSIDLGAGDDFVSISGIGASYVIQGGAGADDVSAAQFDHAEIDGGSGDDALSGTGFDVSLRGGLGDDVLSLSIATADNAGPLTAEGGAGDDTIDALALFGTFLGGDGNDVLNIDCIAIELGDFVVDGGAGNDTITMTQSDPESVASMRMVTIIGGAGNDDINGSDATQGFTAEGFTFATDWGNDTVSGFDLAVDFLIFQNIDGLDNRALLSVSGDATHTVFSFNSQSVRIDDLDLADAGDVLMSFV